LNTKKILIYGYGNPGRQDDGIGACFINKVNKWIKDEHLCDIITDCNYQLNIEDAALISEFHTVIFVDASIVEDIENFKMIEIQPVHETVEFSMHAVSPAYVLDLCRKIYNIYPKTFVLHIKGYEFEFVETISEKAMQNIDVAFSYLKNLCIKYLNKNKI